MSKRRKSKTIHGQSSKKAKKQVISEAVSYSYVHEKPIWRFDMLDHDGKFRFVLDRSDIDCREILQKLMDYGDMEWTEIDHQTHDSRNKSKHHFLDSNGISREAKKRIHVLKLEDNTDILFSFALRNKLRIIGLRDKAEFHLVWLDPRHEFYPSKK